MTDRREQICARLVEIARGLVDRVGRNAPNITGRSEPAIVIWDGDEQADPSDGRRPANVPIMVEMTPELRVLLGGMSEDVGTLLNGWRIEVIKAVIDDAVSGGLRTIIGSNGSVRYEGLSTGLAAGEQTQAWHGIRFAIRYPLIPAEL